MDLVTAGLHQDTFRLHGEPITFVNGRMQRAALKFLQEIYSGDHHLGVLEGSRLVGKTTVAQYFIRQLPAPAAAAIVDCRKLESRKFLATIIKQFGFQIQPLSVSEQLNLLNVFMVRQTIIFHVPLIIIENAHEMCSSAIQALSQLMRARYRSRSALRVVLVSDRSLDAVIDALGMRDVARRKADSFLLGPMTATETQNYLYTKLRAGGCDRPEIVATESLFDGIFEESGGIPGLVDQHMLLRLNAAEELPIASKHRRLFVAKRQALLPSNDVVRTPEKLADFKQVPKLYITLNGESLQNVPLNRSRFLIGRSDDNDIKLNSSLISRHHALLIHRDGATFIMDLNSTNGVFVNSKRIVSLELRHDDIISLGNNVIKLFDPSSRQRKKLDVYAQQETTRMKILDDMQRIIEKKNTCSIRPA